MSGINHSGPAFPCEVSPDRIHENAHQCSHHTMLQYGMTLRQYAAIKLCVPNSGTDWLDEMIRESLRDRAAEKAMTSFLSTLVEFPDENWREAIARDAYLMADALLKAKEASR